MIFEHLPAGAYKIPKIARVFATKTKMCPTDKDAYFDTPDLFTPVYDMACISVTFTWAIKRGIRLKEAWHSRAPCVHIGGPAFEDCGGNFIAGKYLKQGVVITSRGCLNNCSWCFVPKREGKIRELSIGEGNIIQDNNLLACSHVHVGKVLQMLEKQKHIDFSGGLEASRITYGLVERLRDLRIYQIWLAYDHPNAEKPLIQAVNKLKGYFKRDQIRCYVLIGYMNDTLQKAELRLKRAWEIGTLPFAMRYRNNEGLLFKERPWNLLARQWTRPAIMKSIMQ